MSERERVRRAIEEPVGSAARLLDEAAGADLEARLMMLINGWGRGLAAGLEELASALEHLRQPPTTDKRTGEAGPEPPTGRTPPAAREESTGSKSEGAAVEEDEERLSVRAEESRAATAALREQSASERNDQVTPPTGT